MRKALIVGAAFAAFTGSAQALTIQDAKQAIVQLGQRDAAHAQAINCHRLDHGVVRCDLRESGFAGFPQEVVTLYGLDVSSVRRDVVFVLNSRAPAFRRLVRLP